MKRSWKKSLKTLAGVLAVSYTHLDVYKRQLLAGLYEFPNEPGHMTMKEVTEYSKSIGLMPIRVKKLETAKHIFSHIEWHMTGYEVMVDELEKTNQKDFLFIHPEEIEKDVYKRQDL